MNVQEIHNIREACITILSGTKHNSVLFEPCDKFDEVINSLDIDPDSKETLRRSVSLLVGTRNHKRGCNIDKKTKDMLNKVYEQKQYLTKEEREFVAKKCNLTPLQVRVWFANKRIRNKNTKM
uniref:Mating-type protein A1 n=1 Tax=Nakaseomyces delphensis TaxID=51657 RepID=MATA1_NAKDE|nr:RecName: Full=Mating-type protein A1; AltName: Full=MATa1 transcription factor [Nakaseomyces delphensis]CAE84400.1 MATa1 protein [Nakaseomyces delphensis]CAE84408.1 MATa1 transciption factor [Nakaseomyces delphensis]